MQKFSALLLGFALGGCAGLGKHVTDTFWPFGDSNEPKGQGETFRRIRGEVVYTPPIAVQDGDIWPGQPDPVPTIQDVSNPDSHFNRTFHKSLATLNQGLEHQLQENETLSIGEEVSVLKGIKRRSSAIVKGALPSSVPDNAHQYLEPSNHDTVAIPNGDGTTTLIAPDGTVRVVRGTPEAALASLGKAQPDAVQSVRSVTTSDEETEKEPPPFPGKVLYNPPDSE